MTDVGDVGVAMVVVAGLVDKAVQVPPPVAAIVAVEYWQVVWSTPALGSDDTKILIVSTQIVFDVHI